MEDDVSGNRMTVSDGVQQWLTDFLREHGPTPSSQVKIAAVENGYSLSTLKRVLPRIQVRSIPGTTKTMWSLRLNGSAVDSVAQLAQEAQCICPCTCGARMVSLAQMAPVAQPDQPEEPEGLDEPEQTDETDEPEWEPPVARKPKMIRIKKKAPVVEDTEEQDFSDEPADLRTQLEQMSFGQHWKYAREHHLGLSLDDLRQLNSNIPLSLEDRVDVLLGRIRGQE